MTYKTQMDKIANIIEDLVEIREYCIPPSHPEDREYCQQIIFKVIDLAKDIRHTIDPIAAVLENES